ncbi:MAG: HAD hydrolase-like protein [Solobacterium sp.]|nr:HAD hydrolase-like protein [Solobacterium sp.]
MAKKINNPDQIDPKPLVLFDFDGTIMDTETALIASYREIFDRHGKELTKDIIEEASESVPEVIMRKYLSEKKARKYVDEFLFYQQEHLADLIQPTKHAKRTLRWLKENGFKTGVVSSRGQSSLERMLGNAGLSEYLDVICGDAGGEKISLLTKDIVRACKASKKEYCVYVSDSPVNITVAKEAGAYTVAFIEDGMRAMRFIDAGPDFMTAEFSQIPKLMSSEPYWLAYKVHE